MLHTDTLLRGEPTELIPVPHTRIYGVRDDGTPRGYGYFGPLAHLGEEACYATELPIRAGTGLSIPLLVPTLTRDEISHLVSGGRATSTIREKAREHALLRLALGLSPFCTLTEPPLPLPD
jgi:hypothetical protein